MNNNKSRFSSEWTKAVGEYLIVSSKMFSMWANVLSEVHNCEMKVKEDPSKCSDKLDKAIKEAQEFEKFSHEYVIAIKNMKDVLQSY